MENQPTENRDANLTDRLEDLRRFCASKSILFLTGEPILPDSGAHVIAFQATSKDEWNEFLTTLPAISPMLVVVHFERMEKELWQERFDKATNITKNDDAPAEWLNSLETLVDLEGHVDEIMSLSIRAYFLGKFVLLYREETAWAHSFRYAAVLLEVGDQESDDEDEDDNEDDNEDDQEPGSEIATEEKNELSRSVAEDDRFRPAKTVAQRKYVTRQILAEGEHSNLDDWDVSSISSAAGTIFDMDILPKITQDMREGGLSAKEIAARLGLSLSRTNNALSAKISRD